ncbi:hypothetical protein VQH23_08430 [Pararoseomonas sp. SCSIO 73927]|uniref:hypothetical protein n=1 Tax=Pararoseomonas sp. SCSIO 73927 TaxID=3114537 RepID=UPI0030D25F1E
MHEERALAALARAQLSVDSAAEAYLRSLRCIRASRALLAVPVWTTQRRAGWQARDTGEVTRMLQSV